MLFYGFSWRMHSVLSLVVRQATSYLANAHARGVPAGVAQKCRRSHWLVPKFSSILLRALIGRFQSSHSRSSIGIIG